MSRILGSLGIRQKLLVAFLAVVSTVLLISYFAFYLRSQAVLNREIQRSLLATAELAVGQLDARIEGMELAVVQMLSRTQLRTSLKAWTAGERLESTKSLGRILNDARNAMPVLTNLAVFDAEQAYVTGVRSDFNANELPKELFAAAQQRQGYLGLLKAGTPAQRIVMGGALDLEGHRLGYLLAFISLESLEELGSSPSLQTASMSLVISALDASGQQRAILPTLAGGSQSLSFNPIADAKPGQPSLKEGLDYRGVPVMAVLSVSSKTGWGLAAKVDQEVLTKPLREQTNFLALLGLGCLVLAVIFTMLLSGSMTRPILDMTHVTELIASGDMNRRITRLSQDELGVLARSVNQMADRLIALKNELALRVQQQEHSLGRLNEELGHANAELTRLSSTDVLTGLANRRVFKAALATEWARCRRQHAPIALLSFDIDHFKALNDTLGHAAGDLALQRVAAALQEGIRRAGDVLARVGGEEFVALLPQTNLAEAQTLAEELRKRVASAAISHPSSSVGGHVTVSIGVASVIPDETVEPDELFAAADEALYRAKAGGRNRVMPAAHYAQS